MISFYLFIVAIGVSFFSGIRAAEPDMRYSGDAYFDEKNLMDIQVMSTLGLTDEDIKVLKQVDGIENVEAGYSTDALCAGTESQAVLHIMSMLPSMNELTLEEGRLPEKPDECAVDADLLAKDGFLARNADRRYDQADVGNGRPDHRYTDRRYVYDREAEQSILFTKIIRQWEPGSRRDAFGIAGEFQNGCIRAVR